MSSALPPPSYDMLKADDFSSPWAYLDAKQKAFESETTQTRAELQRLGWRLRENHPVTGTWRARRWSRKDGTVLISATTAAELVRLCAENFDKPKLLEAREKAKDEKRKAKAAAKLKKGAH